MPEVASIATCEPIAMELLADPTDPLTVRRIEDQLDALDLGSVLTSARSST